MPSLAYVTLTGQFVDGSGNPANGTVTLQASQTAYASGVPVVSGDSPIVAQIVAGQLLAQGGGSLQILPTDTQGLTLDGPTGWWAWEATPVVNGVAEPSWSFFLPSSPSSVPLWSTRGSGLPGGGVVNSVTAGDTSVVIGGTQANPTVETGRPDQIFTAHPPTAAVAMNGQKLTGLANGAASSDSAAYGQTPAGGNTATIPQGGTGATTQQAALDALAGAVTSGQFLRGNGTHVQLAGIQAGDVPTLNQSTTGNAATATNLAGGATVPAYLAPHVPTLTDAATVAVNAALGNDFRLLTTSGVGASRTIGAPSNPADGQPVTIDVQQAASGGPYTVTWASGAGGYSFGADGAPTLSTAANAVDTIGFRYHAGLGKWICQGWKLGFS